MQWKIRKQQPEHTQRKIKHFQTKKRLVHIVITLLKKPVIQKLGIVIVQIENFQNGKRDIQIIVQIVNLEKPVGIAIILLKKPVMLEMAV
jgi:hypothetical protein